MPNDNQAGVMLSEVIKREKFFFLLHKIDEELAESARAQGCPSVGGRCIKQLTSASPVAAPQDTRRIYSAAEPLLWPRGVPAADFTLVSDVLGAAGILGRGDHCGLRAWPATYRGVQRRQGQGVVRSASFDPEAVVGVLPRNLPSNPGLAVIARPLYAASGGGFDSFGSAQAAGVVPRGS